jgi:hypothetical protein
VTPVGRRNSKPHLRQAPVVGRNIMRSIYLAIFFLIFIGKTAIAQAAKPIFKNFTFDSILIQGIDPWRKTNPSDPLRYVIGKEVQPSYFTHATYLPKVERGKLYNFVTSKISYQGIDSACWNPNFAIFFLQKGKITNYIEISTDCLNLKSNLRTNNSEPLSNYPKKITAEFTSFIKSLINKYKFEEN